MSVSIVCVVIIFTLFIKRRGYCNRLSPSVRPSARQTVCPLCYLSHHWRTFLAPPPWALGRGQKVKYHLIPITKSISAISYQTLCVFSQIKDTKHIRWVFFLSPWSCPRGGALWRWGCPGGQKLFNFKHGHVAYQIDEDDEQTIMNVKCSS